MTNLNYSNYLKDKDFDIEKNYYELFYKKEKEFESLKKEYPYNVIFFHVVFKDLISKNIKKLIEILEKEINDIRKKLNS